MVYTDGAVNPAGYSGNIRGDIHQAMRDLGHLWDQGYTIVGHNVLGYDFPLLKKLGHLDMDYVVDGKAIVDTYIGVCLRFPEERPGLDYWGQKFGVRKPVHEDWSVLSSDMIHRCSEDTKINEVLLRHLDKHGYFGSKWNESLHLEQQVLWIHAQQVLHGMRVDVYEAAKVLRRLDDEIRRLTVVLHKKFPQTCVNQGELKAIFKQDGSLTHHVDNWLTNVGLRGGSVIQHPTGHALFPEPTKVIRIRSEEHTSELQSHSDLVCRLLLEKKKTHITPAQAPPTLH